jgi:frataxin
MKSLSRAIGTAAHRSLRPIRAQTTRNCLIPSASVAQRSTIPCSTVRSYHPSQTLRSLLPEVENPAPKESEASERPTVPTDISNEEYNQRADEFLDELLHRLEMQQDKRPDLEVEYSVCLTSSSK